MASYSCDAICVNKSYFNNGHPELTSHDFTVRWLTQLLLNCASDDESTLITGIHNGQHMSHNTTLATLSHTHNTIRATTTTHLYYIKNITFTDLNIQHHSVPFVTHRYMTVHTSLLAHMWLHSRWTFGFAAMDSLLNRREGAEYKYIMLFFQSFHDFLNS